MIDVSNSLFGFSTTVANIRASIVGMSSLREKFCLAFTTAFGYSEYISQGIYQQVKQSNTNNMSGFAIGSQYDIIEQKVYDILDTNYPLESTNKKKIWAISVNSILFSYYVHSNLNLSDVVYLIGLVLNGNCIYITNDTLFYPDGNGNVYHPFTEDIIKSFLKENYLSTIQALNGDTKDSSINVVNYNWMEVEDIFAKPNLSLMKDIENQYYYLSGNLSYKSNNINTVDCISIPVTINTPTGQATFQYYLQEPCIENNNSIRPVTGVSFYRIFNDGPYTSGDFNDSVKNAYLQFDKNILNPTGYSSNSKILYSFLTGSDSGYLPISFANVFTDANGQYNLNQEYTNVPADYSCSQTYSGNMHIGNNEAKIICDRDEFNNCINCRFVPMTGFKFASLELDRTVWWKKFANIKTNPFSNTDNILKRALNTLPYSYLSTMDGNSLKTMGLFNNQYLGYPQLTGQNSLPNIAFFQNFDSSNFNKLASISMYPSIGVSNNGTDSDSDRQYQISPLNIFSGVSSSHVPFGESGYSLIKFSNSITSSGLSSDLVAQQFFGMGNNFNNQFNIVSTSAFNAGYVYTGAYVDNSGIYTNLTYANLQYERDTLGSKVKTIKFVSGYRSDVGREYLVKKIYAQDSGGHLIPYYNLKNEDLPLNLQINEIQTTSFTPLPDVLESQLFLSHISGEQIVENYFPRYSSGAFATFEQKFLYPKAQEAANQYDSKKNGFPIKINFILNIREESVRELYGRFIISNRGLISSSPKYMNVIRPTKNNDINPSLVSPSMYQIFVPDNSLYSRNYDFNNFDINSNFGYVASLSMVDNNWSPYLYRSFTQDSSGDLVKQYFQTNTLPPTQYDPGYFMPSGRNSLLAENNNNPFFQGVRLTGNGALAHKWFTGTGMNQYKIIYDESPYLNGLYHYYQPLQISGYLLYTPPYFDLSSGSGYINSAIKEAFKLMVNGNSNSGPINCRYQNDIGCATPQGSYTQSISGITGYLPEGVDPIFLEYMGGRSGDAQAIQEGGYHSKGLVGDIWNNFSFQAYGMLGGQENLPCGNNTRWPSNDNKLVLISSSPNQTKIFTRALSFNPFIINQYNYHPFVGNEEYTYVINNTTGLFPVSVSHEFGKVDLNTYMPLKDITGNGWYDNSGLILGPFDRDMELGVLNGAILYANNADLFCNGNRITDVSGMGGCDANTQYYNRNGLNSGIIPNEHGRSERFTIFAVVAQGNTVSLNLFGINTGEKFGFAHLTGESGTSLNNSILTLRPRKIIGASRYDSNIHYGEESWTSPFSFLNNGLEKQYTIPTNIFDDLNSTSLSVTTYSKSGKLYPIPNSNFTGLARADSNGNFIYPLNATVENYWRNFAVKNNQSVIVSGWREGSRISFQFSNISVEYDVIPYQTQKIIVPSGECIVSGEMGYLKQADASIYTAGVILKDNTEEVKDEFENYSPSFYSEVLNRLPWITGISGQYPNPILPAPSIMIQRLLTGIISGNQEYNNLLNFAPYNYNKLNWAALSDLETLNNGETLEAILPSDPITFNNSNIIFSASQGQDLPNGQKNPDVNQKYDVVEAYQTYDSIATDALINSGVCLTTKYGTRNRLEQKYALSGVIAPINMTLSMIKNGFI